MTREEYEALPFVEVDRDAVADVRVTQYGPTQVQTASTVAPEIGVFRPAAPTRIRTDTHTMTTTTNISTFPSPDGYTSTTTIALAATGATEQEAATRLAQVITIATLAQSDPHSIEVIAYLEALRKEKDRESAAG